GHEPEVLRPAQRLSDVHFTVGRHGRAGISTAFARRRTRVPTIYVFAAARKTWMRGSSPRMTKRSLLEHLNADRLGMKALRAPQLAGTGIAACSAQAIHFRTKINVRDRIEKLLLGEHRPA